MILIKSILAFIIALTLLIFIHEFGHFLVARFFKVKVKRFSIGFGRVLYSFKDRHQTEWAFSWILMGGYISMLNSELDHIQPDSPDYPHTIDQQSLFRKYLIIIAGPFFNLIFAFLLFMGLNYYPHHELAPVIGAVIPQSLMDQAGLQSNDKVLRVQNQPVSHLKDIQIQLQKTIQDQDPYLHLVVERHHQSLSFSVPLQSIYTQLNPSSFKMDTLLFHLGIPHPSSAFTPARIKSITAKSPASQSGLKEGDLILSVNQHPIHSWSSLVTWIVSHPNQPLSLTVQTTENTLKTVQLTPSILTRGLPAKMGATVQMDHLPASVVEHMYITTSLTLFESLQLSLQQCSRFMELSFQSLKGLFSSHASMQQLSGPVGIANQAGQSMEIGFSSYLQFSALLSLSLFFMNLLPIPGLDGGQLLMMTLEHCLPPLLMTKLQSMMYIVSFSLLGGLTAFSFINDLAKLL